VLGIGGGLLPKVLSGEKGLLSPDGESGHASRLSQVNEFPSYLQVQHGQGQREGSPSYRHRSTARSCAVRRYKLRRKTGHDQSCPGGKIAVDLPEVECVWVLGCEVDQAAGDVACTVGGERSAEVLPQRSSVSPPKLRSNARDSQAVYDKLTTTEDERL
jgi:hypothetical protein